MAEGVSVGGPSATLAGQSLTAPADIQPRGRHHPGHVRRCDDGHGPHILVGRRSTDQRGFDDAARDGRVVIRPVNSLILIGDPTSEGWTIFGSVVVIQTLAIGFGLCGGVKMTDISEQRRVVLAGLEAALEENAGLHAQLVTQARETDSP